MCTPLCNTLCIIIWDTKGVKREGEEGRGAASPLCGEESGFGLREQAARRQELGTGYWVLAAGRQESGFRIRASGLGIQIVIGYFVSLVCLVGKYVYPVCPVCPVRLLRSSNWVISN
jgi:hypothetical protein